ncbi:MAG: succinyldiaminopimelate transaminase, partial [Nanoarchaeota archaeon]
DCTPDATLYLWQKTPEKMNSVDFAKKLLQKEIAVVVTPGAWLSTKFDGLNPGNDFVRFALVPSLEETKKAAERIKEHLK